MDLKFVKFRCPQPMSCLGKIVLFTVTEFKNGHDDAGFRYVYRSTIVVYSIPFKLYIWVATPIFDVTNGYI